MICVDKDKLAEIVEKNCIVSKVCNDCLMDVAYGYCALFNKEINIDRYNDRLPECKELFKEEVENEK